MSPRLLLVALMTLLLACAPLLAQAELVGEPVALCLADALEGGEVPQPLPVVERAVLRRMEAPPREAAAPRPDPDLPEPERPPRSDQHSA